MVRSIGLATVTLGGAAAACFCPCPQPANTQVTATAAAARADDGMTLKLILPNAPYLGSQTGGRPYLSRVRERHPPLFRRRPAHPISSSTLQVHQSTCARSAAMRSADDA